VLKVPAATRGLLRHRGRAVIFEGYEEMRRRVEDPNLAVDATSVLVLRGCGPAGRRPGMPEWGMIPIPARLRRAERAGAPPGGLARRQAAWRPPASPHRR
jgi:dihydroxyacid dehydratase/phosphogluconate dehydratase